MGMDLDKRPDRSGTGSLKWERYAGTDVLPMWVADMDFPSPPEVVAALRERADHEVFGYTLAPKSTVDAVVAYMARVHDLEIDPGWIVWLPGLVPALNTSARAFAAEGEHVMTCTPVYPPFLTAPGNQGRELDAAPMKRKGDRYYLDFTAMENLVTSRTKAFVLCNPHNPVGRCFTEEELVALLDFCERHDLILISDEIHCDLLFSGARHIPTLKLGERAAKRCVTLMAPSKTYNLPGLACAYAIIPNANVRLRFQRAMRGMITEVNCFGYAGCEAAYTHGEPWRREVVAYLEANRDFLWAYLANHMPDVTMPAMEATYLAWLDFRATGIERPAAFFEKHGVGLSNGFDFDVAKGPHAPGHARLNFGCPRSMLTEALDRIRSALDKR